MKTLSSFTIIKNEIPFIKAHIDAWVNHLDGMVFFDGNSTDGTLEVLREYAKKTPKIILAENKDPKDLTDDYVRIFDEALKSCPTDLAIYIHPDFIPDNPEALRKLPDDIIAGTCNIRSFAGNPGETIYEIKGRGGRWKNIYRLRNPDLGAHYFGHYGVQNEDVYFSEITGNAHEHYEQDFAKYPYPICDSPLIINHYSDVRPYARRLERMERCLINQGYSPDVAKVMAPKHPRVSLKDSDVFKFVEVSTPSFMEGH
jgi:glycosyltransferase involved in cell wall biosynthesis